jgi:small subunit ribosomal protein S6
LKTVAKNKLYEGMFLVDSAHAGSDWEGVIASITRILEKAKAEIVSIRKWDDRKLAYSVDGKTRGTYILCYFKADGRKIRDIEKAVQLSEQIMRVLILNAERMTKEDMEKETPATKAEKEKDKHKDDVEENDEDVDTEQMSDDRDDEQDDDDQQDREKTEDSQESEADPVVEDSVQEQSEVSQIEDPEEADEQEQLQL